MTRPVRADLLLHAQLMTQLLNSVESVLGPTQHQLVDELFRRYDALDRRLASFDSQHVEPPELEATTRSTAASPAAYGAVVASVRAFLAGLANPGAACVVSRGDRALVDAGDARARHFPADDLGGWAGFHPADGIDALARLESAMRTGATHLVVPATSRWWLDYYRELAEHLARHATVVRDDEHLVAWEIATAPVAPERSASIESLRYAGQVRRFLDLADAVVPVGAHLAVITRGDDALLRVPDVHTSHFPSDGHGTYIGHPLDDADAVGALHAAIERGAGFLGLPAPLSWWGEAYCGFVDHLDSDHRRIASQPDVGVLYELTAQRLQFEGTPR